MSSVLFDAFNLSSAASLDFQTIFAFMKPLVNIADAASDLPGMVAEEHLSVLSFNAR